MADQEHCIVTGAFSFTGKYIARRLLADGKRVRTLTNHPEWRDPASAEAEIEAVPYNFNNPDALTASLRGATAVYSTYWVRFSRGAATYDQAVRNIATLVRAAEAAGVQTFVHIGVSNAREDAPWPYFRGKARADAVVMASAMTHCIIRPTIVFGKEDVLVNNIAWMLRTFPVYAIPGSGAYRLQPVYVDDVAELAVRAAAGGTNVVMDAAGPEVFTYEEMVRMLAGRLGRQVEFVHVPPAVALGLSRMLDYVVGDIVVFKEELEAVMAELHVSPQPPTGRTRFTDWLDEHARGLGRRYTSELARHYR